MVFSDQDITAIIQDVERQVLGLASDTLKKGEGSKSASAGGPPGADEGSASAASGGDGGSSASPADAGDPSAPPAAPGDSAAASAPAPGAPGADPAASAAGAAPAGAPAGGAATDPALGDHEALVSEFAKMPPEDVAKILEAAKQVLLAQQPAGGAPAPSPMEPSAAPTGLAQSEVGDGGLDGGKPAGSASPAPAEPGRQPNPEQANGQSPMHPGSDSGNMHAKLASPSNLVPTSTFKGEGGPMNPGPETGKTHVSDASMLGTSTQTPEGGLHGVARKSEVDAELAALRKANQDLNARMERLISVTQELVEKPIRKAVTGLDIAFMPKPTASQGNPSASMSREQITRKLNDKARDPSLSKADRELITDFYCRSVGLEKIEHLLK